MLNVNGVSVEICPLSSFTEVQHCSSGVSRIVAHGGSTDAGSGRKRVKEKGDEKDGMKQVRWRPVYRSVSLIADLGHQGSYGSFGTRLGIRDTEVPQCLCGEPGAQGWVHDVELQPIGWVI